MSIHPETYGFVLDVDYFDVRRWVLTGELPEKKDYLIGWLCKNKEMIWNWVKHNEAHWRQIKNLEALKSKPVIRYVEFYEQYLRVERWLELWSTE